MTSKIVILGTGGTIAGKADSISDNVAYVAGQVAVQDLIVAVPPLGNFDLECHQVAQLDSKDISHAVWARLARAAEMHVARSDVAGIVITHGTDTLEESAWFLQRVLAPAKPVVLTAAMRPASALVPDGPQNLLDAVLLACCPDAGGVLAVLAGKVWTASDVRKLQPYSVDAFTGGDAGPVARVVEGQVIQERPWPHQSGLAWAPIGTHCLPEPPTQQEPQEPEPWPWVAILPSHGGADARQLQALLGAGVDGLVVEGTGNGTVHRELEALLKEAVQSGLPVLRASRCLAGGVVGEPKGALASAGALTPAKARVELMLRLLAAKSWPA